MTEPDDLYRPLLALAGSIMEDASATVILGKGAGEMVRCVSLLEARIDDLAAIARVMRLIEAANSA